MSGFSMVDVGGKDKTRRRAIAAGKILLGPEAYPLVAERRLPKGDALTLAEVAGIQGAKKTPDLIPLCHPIGLTKVKVMHVLRPEEQAVEAFCLAVITERTGVEMEALTGASTALLTIWDLSKPVEAALKIDALRLLYKEGGKSGTWINPEGLPDEARQLLDS